MSRGNTSRGYMAFSCQLTRSMAFLLFLFTVSHLISVTESINSVDNKCADHPDRPCPADCGETTDIYGCKRCMCGVPFYRPPMRDCPNGNRKCPSGCGEQVDKNGCRKCFCGANPFFRAPVASVVCPFGTYC